MNEKSLWEIILCTYWGDILIASIWESYQQLKSIFSHGRDCFSDKDSQASVDLTGFAHSYAWTFKRRIQKKYE